MDAYEAIVFIGLGCGFACLVGMLIFLYLFSRCLRGDRGD